MKLLSTIDYRRLTGLALSRLSSQSFFLIPFVFIIRHNILVLPVVTSKFHYDSDSPTMDSIDNFDTLVNGYYSLQCILE